jgi:eukaryotic-like serine/threonine-protein kinase
LGLPVSQSDQTDSLRTMGFFDRFKGGGKGKKLDVDSRFELLREAISGTMSKFYMARERRTGDIVGLKIGDLEKIDAFESRFKGLNKPSEGEIASSFNHPNIVRTLEYGLTTKGLRYVIMEYLAGHGLHTLIANRDPLLSGKRVGLVRQMASALECVHRAEYIHRDICPRNFICSADAMSLKLIDFGLSLPNSKNFVQPGNRTGTPIFMAPEVSRRRGTDQRVDLFSLGVSSYQMCAFELPWPVGENPAISALRYDTDPPRDIRRARPDLSPLLAEAIMKCLSASPNQRPASATEFLQMIRDVPEEEHREVSE